MGRKRRIKKPAAQAEQWQTPEKRQRGQGVFYDEPKSERLQIALTPTAKKKLENLANLNELSISELLERWLRGEREIKLP